MPESTHRQIQREIFIRSFFDAHPPSELAEMLAAQMRDRVFEAGEMIYERGQPSGKIYLVTSGTVELALPGHEPWIFSGQSFLGGIDANAGQPYSRTATAVTRTSAVEMHFENYLLLLEDFIDFAQATMVQGSKRTHQSELLLAPDAVFAPSTSEKGPWHGAGPLDSVQKLMVLRSSEAFAAAPVQALVSLARATEELRFEAGEVLFEPGSSVEGMDVIIDGQLRVEGDAPPFQSVVGPGQLGLGVTSISTSPHPYRGTAVTELAILRLPHEAFFDTMEEHFALVRAWWTYMGRENYRSRLEMGRRGLTSDIQVAPPRPMPGGTTQAAAKIGQGSSPGARFSS